MAKVLSTDEELRGILGHAKAIAVLGAHTDMLRPAFYVPAYLQRRGYRILPVNAVYAGQELLGATLSASLKDLRVEVDIVDIFRRADKLEEHVPEILAMNPRPKAVWLQLGIQNDAFAEKLVGQGIDVVQNRCLKAEHERLYP